MFKKTTPKTPARKREAGDFNRRYAVPLILVGSVLFTWLIILFAGIR